EKVLVAVQDGRGRLRRGPGPCHILRPIPWRGVTELGTLSDDLDSQAFSSPAADADGFELAALYTLQHRLAGDAEPQPRLQHRQIVWRGVFDEARAQFVGDPNAPRGAWGELLADDDAGGEPTVQRGRRYREDLGGFL